MVHRRMSTPRPPCPCLATQGRTKVENAMAFIPLPDGIRIVMEYTLDSKTVVNVYHLKDDLPITPTRLLQAVTIFREWWDNHLSAEISEDLVLQQVIGTDVSVENGTQEFDVPNPSIPGQDVIGATPSNVALVTTLKTAFTGRSFRGRSYIAAIPKTSITDNDVGLTKATNILNDFSLLVADLLSSSFSLTVASYVSGGAPRTTAVNTPVTILSVNIRVDTQRRRIPSL